MKRMLVVDDKEEVRMVYQLLFTGEDLDVLEAENGREALEIVKRESIDLVLSDCLMPEMNGVELMREAQKVRPDLPFVFVSANIDKEDMEDLKPVAVLPKPFELGKLREVVHHALDRHTP